VELFEAIRRDDRVEQLSVRALADKYGVHRRTVRQALANAVPPERKTPVRVAPKLDPAKGLIDAMLMLDLTAPRKQRHTARRILARLVDEHELADLTYSAVRDYVAKRRPELWAAAGKGLGDAFVPQTHEPGAEGEVDFADLWIDLAGVRTKVFLFTMRLSFSGKAVHRAYATPGQEAFLEGHLAAFAVFGGTPMFHIRYDNLKAAVSRVLFGRTRTESTRWIAFRSHHGFEAFYCHPGVEGAHEKGGVEGEGGRFRRNHLVPVPKVDTMAELNELLIGYDLADDARRISNRTLSVGQHFTFEASLLRPLPTELFETGLVLTPRVDRYSRVTVRQCFYSVPARLIGHQIRGVLHALELVLFNGRTEVARHERATARGSEVLVLDHYLEVLVRKPGALRGATALVQARAAGTFTSAHEAFWAAALRARVAELRPVYLPPDPASRTAYAPGEIAQCDFWFPDLEIPVGWGQTRTAKTLPVLTMVTGYSRFASAVLIPSRNAEDLYAGWWQLIAGLGAVPRVLVWDGEGAVGRWRGKRAELTGHCQAFRGVLGSKVIICAPGDPEAKGAVERFHHWVETSFLPGRTFASPADFNTQLGGWLSIANGRVKRSLGCAPTDRLGADLQAMLGLPPVSPQVGWRISTRLPRDYYVRLDSNDYSIHPSVVGRRVEVHADLARVWATCDGKLVADHQRVWARHQSVTEFEHQVAAKALQRGRADLLKPLLDADVQVRHLASYDTLLGIDADLTDRDGAA